MNNEGSIMQFKNMLYICVIDYVINRFKLIEIWISSIKQANWLLEAGCVC